jgi:hypothetical protein
MLQAIKDLIQRGMVSAVTTPAQPALEVDSGLVGWPDELEDFSEALVGYSKERISSRRMADVWL